MFAEVKGTLPISGDDYDAEIIMQIKACALDLTTSAEIVLPGEIAITREQDRSGAWTITDDSTVTDELIITAISIWCNMRIGNPPNYEQLSKAYASLKGQLRLSRSYTNYDGSGEADADEDDDQLPADPVQP